jgi:D-tyrosyl-tRNA(Tyr) deacylase
MHPMRAVIQRVSESSVTLDGSVTAAIGTGLLLFLGIEAGDTDSDVSWLAGKVTRLRVFNDDQGLMNRSLGEVGGDILVVSQFTLFASTLKGNRPSYGRSARPEEALPLYEQFVGQLAGHLGKSVPTGRFGAKMKVHLVNDGPVTILIDTRDRE